MENPRIEWRRGEGWFRVWLLVTFLWYLSAAVLIPNIHDFKRQITISGRAEFLSVQARNTHLAHVRKSSSAACVAGTFRTGTETVRGPDFSVLDGLSSGNWFEAYADIKSGARNVPIKTIYVSKEAHCEDTLKTARMAFVAIAAITLPFAVALALYLAFYFSKIVVVGASATGRFFRRVGGWVIDGFHEQINQEKMEETAELHRVLGFGREFVPRIKPVLFAVGGAAVTLWVVFSLGTGIRATATSEALIESLIVAGAVGVIALVSRFIRSGHPVSDRSDIADRDNE